MHPAMASLSNFEVRRQCCRPEKKIQCRIVMPRVRAECQQININQLWFIAWILLLVDLLLRWWTLEWWICRETIGGLTTSMLRSCTQKLGDHLHDFRERRPVFAPVEKRRIFYYFKYKIELFQLNANNYYLIFLNDNTKIQFSPVKHLVKCTMWHSRPLLNAVTKKKIRMSRNGLLPLPLLPTPA